MRLESMAKAYRSLITALELVENMSLETAKSKLLQEEPRQREQASRADESSSRRKMAMTTKGRTGQLTKFFRTESTPMESIAIHFDVDFKKK